MPVQILGLRPYTARDGKQKLRTVFFNREYRLPSVEQVLQNHAAILEQIPHDQHYNLFFTVAQCQEDRERVLKEQWVIPFDIDSIAITGESPEELRASALVVFRAVCAVLKVDPLETGGLFSGHGVQVFVPIAKPITDSGYFDSYRQHYKVVADMISLYLREQGIQGTVDASVFSDARLMRMPSTWNKKEGKVERKSFVLNSTLVANGFDIVSLAGIGHEAEAAPVLRRYPKPDTAAVCTGCKFLQHCNTNQGTVSEPQWYAMLSITTRLDDGEVLSHAYSDKHAQYSHYETEVKIKQALASAGPRTCKNIETLWDGCKTCDNYGIVLSPITIKGPDYIKTRDSGFRDVRLNEAGLPVAGKPAYDDLIKYFDQELGFKVLPDTRQVFTYNGTHWQEMLELEVRGWMTELVVPSPAANEMSEFYNRVLAQTSNQARLDTMYARREGKANFKNGTLDYMGDGKLRQHTAEDGFTSVLPYNYNPDARCDKFEVFLKDIFEHDEVIAVIKEYLGYCVSGDNCWLQKSLMLVGRGANGKSVLLETLAATVGRDNVAAVPVQELGNPIARSSLVNKLFNYSEETAYRSLTDSSVFKTLVTGGTMTVKKLYQQPYEVANKAKFIMSANEFPLIYDLSDGLFRRLIVVRMMKSFAGAADNKSLRGELLEELPGIFNMLIGEYKNLRQRGHLIDSEILAATHREAREESDPVFLFLDACAVVSDDLESIFTTKDGMYAAYRMWATNNGFHPMNNVHFFRQLKTLIPNLDERSRRVNIGDDRPRVIMGIRIKDNY